jgi:hypothetical protein
MQRNSIVGLGLLELGRVGPMGAGLVAIGKLGRGTGDFTKENRLR